jgi:hypothetical protein
MSHINVLALKSCDAADPIIDLRRTGTGATCGFENFATR